MGTTDPAMLVMIRLLGSRQKSAFGLTSVQFLGRTRQRVVAPGPLDLEREVGAEGERRSERAGGPVREDLLDRADACDRGERVAVDRLEPRFRRTP